MIQIILPQTLETWNFLDKQGKSASHPSVSMLQNRQKCGLETWGMIKGTASKSLMVQAVTSSLSDAPRLELLLSLQRSHQKGKV